MKNIEQLIKESLKNHELPYNAAMWDSVSKRLDGTPSTPFYRRWWVAASIGTALVGSAIFFAVLNTGQKETQKTTKTAAIQDVNPSNNQTTPVAKNITNTPGNAPSSSDEHKLNIDPIQNTQTTSNNVQSTNTATQAADVKKTNNTTSSPDVKSVDPVKTAANNNSENNPVSTTYIPLKKTVYCLGDDIILENPNNVIMAVSMNGKSFFVASQSKKSITPSNDGTIELKVGDSKKTITVVKPEGNIYIDVDPTLLYNDGIPSIEFVANADNGIQWQVEKHPSELKNGKLIVHPYVGQEITVTAVSKDNNGCAIKEVKTIYLNEKYNLQAATGFRPNSGDSRTNSFMPFALKERNVAFEFVVYDAKSGLEIFRSNDASNGWKGTNKNGDALNAGTTYLWKVMLHNPNPGEPSEYKGQITITE